MPSIAGADLSYKYLPLTEVAEEERCLILRFVLTSFSIAPIIAIFHPQNICIVQILSDKEKANS